MPFKVFPFLLIAILLSWSAAAQEVVIDEVHVEGVRRVSPATVQAVLTVAPGDELSREEIDRSLRAIFALQNFEDVAADLEERNGRNVLIFRVQERPLLRRVEFAGNKALSDDKLRGQLPFRTPAIYRPQLSLQTIETLRAAYHKDGYYGVEIEPSLEIDADNEATITFRIEEGRKIYIRNIRFEGNTVLSDRALRKSIETRQRWFLSWLTGRGTFQEEILQNDLEILADQYYNRGYIQVRVLQPEVIFSEDRRSLEIVIEIEEGEQFRVGQLEFRGDLVEDLDLLRSRVRFQTGEVFSRQRLRQSILSINDFYADMGYAYVNVSPLTRIDMEKREVDVVFDIEQGIQVFIDRIRIRGNTKTRDKVIRRELTLVEGDLYNATALKESRRRVFNLGFFEEVNVASAAGDDESLMDLDVQVSERPTGMFTVGVGYSSIDGVVGQGSISQANFLGRGLRLELAGSFGSRTQTYQIGVTDPYFLDRNLTVGFDLYKTEREWVDFTRKAFGGNVKLGFPVTDNTRNFWVYRYEEKEITDVDPNASRFILEQEGKSTLSSVTSTLSRNTTDYRLDPSRGSVSTLSIEYAGLGGTEKFIKYNADHRHFWPWRWGTVFSLRGHLGFVQGHGGRAVPIDERFFLGGLNTIRGFQARQVGPRIRRVEEIDGRIFESFEYIGGVKAAYFNAEYLFPLVREMGLKGVIFFDTGNAWDSGEEFFNDMRYSWGGGIRWFSPMGPLRLEWGRNLDPREGEPRSRFDFSIGTVF
jgi:outer membrane protein insertion porin family